MVTYTQQELLNRNKIIQSQIQFGRPTRKIYK